MMLILYLIWFSIISNIFSEGNVGKFVRNERTCTSDSFVLLKILGELEQNRQTGTLRFLDRSVSLMIFGDYIFVMPFLYAACIANSAFFAIVPQLYASREPKKFKCILHGYAPYSFCSSDLNCCR